MASGIRAGRIPLGRSGNMKGPFPDYPGVIVNINPEEVDTEYETDEDLTQLTPEPYTTVISTPERNPPHLGNDDHAAGTKPRNGLVRASCSVLSEYR